jgi:hypothetical protein
MACHAFIYSSNGKGCAYTDAQIALSERNVIAKKTFGTDLKGLVRKRGSVVTLLHPVAKLIHFDLEP